MKSTGIVRKVDELGRIVLPIELRRLYGIAEHDPVEICVDGDCIILKKYRPGCCICGEAKDILYIGNTPICRKCAENLGRMAAENGRNSAGQRSWQSVSTRRRRHP